MVNPRRHSYDSEMLRRWLIRSVVMQAILLCVGGWVFSRGYSVSMWYMRENGDYLGCATYDGLCYLDGGRNFNANPGWNCQVNSPHDAVMLPVRYTAAAPEDTYEFFGFGFIHYPEEGWRGPNIVHVPYWLLIGVFSSVLCVVWRKTQPQPDAATAFPVRLAERS